MAVAGPRRGCLMDTDVHGLKKGGNGRREGGREEGGKCMCDIRNSVTEDNVRTLPQSLLPTSAILSFYLRHVHLPISQHSERLFHGLEGLAHIQCLGWEGGMEGGRGNCESMRDEILVGEERG